MPTRQAGATMAVRTSKPPKPMTVAQRDKLAKRGIANALATSDDKLATTATLELVNEMLSWYTGLKQQLGAKYAELQKLAQAELEAKATRASAPKPTPISGPDLGRFSPYGKLDPYKMVEWYGRGDLRSVLSGKGITAASLREAVDLIQTQVPGTKPRSRTKKDDMVEYIMEHVAPGC